MSNFAAYRKMVRCPYDLHHEVRCDRLHYHIVKCAKVKKQK